MNVIQMNLPPSKRLSRLKPEWSADSGAQAIQALAEACVRRPGGGTLPIMDFLLGIHNGMQWKPDMQLLCYRIEEEHFALVLAAMRFTRKFRRELCELFVLGEELVSFLDENTCKWRPCEETVAVV